MNLVRRTAYRFQRNESGATVVEYGLIIGLMTLALLGALAATGDSTADSWDGVATDVGEAMTSAGE